MIFTTNSREKCALQHKPGSKMGSGYFCRQVKSTKIHCSISQLVSHGIVYLSLGYVFFLISFPFPDANISPSHNFFALAALGGSALAHSNTFFFFLFAFE